MKSGKTRLNRKEEKWEKEGQKEKMKGERRNIQNFPLYINADLNV